MLTFEPLWKWSLLVLEGNVYQLINLYVRTKNSRGFFLLWFYESLCSHNQSEEPKMKHKPVVLRWLLGTWASFLITWTSPLTDKVGITYLLRKMVLTSYIFVGPNVRKLSKFCWLVGTYLGGLLRGMLHYKVRQFITLLNVREDVNSLVRVLHVIHEHQTPWTMMIPQYF